MKRQNGLVMVEFAIVATAFFIILFGVIEVGRLLYAWNMITEMTRRGARVAAVCPVNHADVARVTVFTSPGGGNDSPFLPDLSTANINVGYFDENGVATTNYTDIKFVRVTMQNYQHTLLIPLIPAAIRTLQVPPFSTTLPAESLGYIPDLGARQCFGA